MLIALGLFALYWYRENKLAEEAITNTVKGIIGVFFALSVALHLGEDKIKEMIENAELQEEKNEASNP